MSFARRAAVTAAAMVISSRIIAPISRLPRSNHARTIPTSTIWTRPRAMEIAASRSRCTAKRRHVNTTARQSTMAPAACANPRATLLPRLFSRSVSIQHLLGGPDRHHAAGLKLHGMGGDARSLGPIVGDNHAGHVSLLH